MRDRYLRHPINSFKLPRQILQLLFSLQRYIFFDEQQQRDQLSSRTFDFRSTLISFKGNYFS